MAQIIRETGQKKDCGRRNQRFLTMLVFLLMLLAGSTDAAAKEGLMVEVYNGEDVEQLQEAPGRKPAAVFVTSQLQFDTPGDLYDGANEEYVFIRWRGTLSVEQSGEYTFFTDSDDGSMLYVDGSAVVENPGSHGSREESGTVQLSSGSHSIMIEYFQERGGAKMEVSWKPPGGEKEALPSSVLSPHDDREPDTAREEPSGETSDKKDPPSVTVRWTLDDKQYVLYEDGKLYRVFDREPDAGPFDVFGYELTGDDHPVPDPGLVNKKEDVPRYLALFLPDQPLSVRSEFTYERTLTMGTDHRFSPYNRFVPSVVRAEGSVEKTEQVQGRRTFRIQQSLEAELDQNYESKMKEAYEGDWSHFDSGEMDVTLWYDPEAGLVRKLRYDANLSFTDGSVSDQQTYLLSAHHEIAGKRDGQGFRQRVRAAIERGVQFLKQEQEEDGTWGDRSGETAIGLLTLLKSDVDKEDPAVKKALDWLFEETSTSETYDVALEVMALEAYKEDPFLRRKERKYVNGQMTKAEYEQFLKANEEKAQFDFTSREKEWLNKRVKFLVRSLNEEGGWRYGADDDGWDHSCDQYGALGLHSAVRMGARVPADAWKRILMHWVQTQQPDGHSVDLKLNVLGQQDTSVQYDSRARGWTYQGMPKSESENGKKIYGDLESVRLPMVVGGIGSIQLAMTNLSKQNRLSPELRKKGRQAILDGWSWLQAHWSLRSNPEDDWGESEERAYYGMYGFERAGVFTRVRSIGGRNWYEEGAELLMSRQRANGSWNDEVVETCFALLFLKRATAPVRTLGH